MHDEEENTPATEPNSKDNVSGPGNNDIAAIDPAPKRHRFPRWLRITLKSLMGIIITLLILPLLIYIPPVQTMLKNIACDVVYKSTGMKIGISRFSIGFPLDVRLDGVSVLTQQGDTMVSARQAIADVKLLPLLSLDVKIKRLQLLDGYYRMISPDSSMIMAIRAGRLDLDNHSSANISKSEILLGDAFLKDGSVSLYMNVWKKQPSPADTSSTPFLIKARRLRLENFTYAMSMLPTIDSLRFHAKRLELLKGVVDLRTNNITAERLSLDGGGMRYITPTPQYVAANPAPIDTISPPSAPIRIKADSIAINNFNAIYAMKGARPQPGFDANYIEVKDVGIGLRNFFNEASTVVLPLTRLTATERCGLRVLKGSGTVSIDSTGLQLHRIDLATPYSTISANAGVPFSLMSMQPDAPLQAEAKISLGMPDINAFLPAARSYTRMITGQRPLNIALRTAGTLSRISIDRLDAAISNALSLRLHGFADNVLDYKNLVASLDIDGSLTQPSLITSIIGNTGVPIPRLAIKGTATAHRQNFTADLAMNTSDGDVKAKGRVSLSPEGYDADIDINSFNLAPYLPGAGLGRVTGNISASGSHFNPLSTGAGIDLQAIIQSLHYNGHDFRNIDATATLHNTNLTLNASCPDPDLDFAIEGSGRVLPDNYTFDISANLRNINLQAIGLDTTRNAGSALFTIAGTASPQKWLYDVRADISSVNWIMGQQIFDLPQGAAITLNSSGNHTSATIESMLTSIDFDGDAGLERFINAFTRVGDIAARQIAERSLDVDTINNMLPRFDLRANASGRGLLGMLLHDTGIRTDTLSVNLSKDSLINGNVYTAGIMSGSMQIDTITLGLQQRASLLDYALHMGNRPGTMDEFANVDLKGYLGENRLAASLTQRNIKNETGYRLGLTAALMPGDDITVHFTPRKATIAYMPWTFNADNHVDLNLKTFRTSANLQASSAESSILIATEPADDGQGDHLHINLTNIHIQDFLKMAVNAPDITADINSDIKVKYNQQFLGGKGSLNISDLTYNSIKVGSFDTDLLAGMDFDGNSKARAALKIDGKQAMALTAFLKSTPQGLQPDSIGVSLTGFPLKVANAFLGPDIASLSGALNGNMSMSGSFTSPILNGGLGFDDVKVYIPMMGSSLRLTNDSIDVADNVLTFKDFDIWGANKNPITINGNVNARNFSNILLDLALQGNNFQLINNDKRAKSDLYGKLFLSLNATAKGSVNTLDVNGNVNVLSSTNVFYTIPEASNPVAQQQNEEVVRFVNFNDTTQVSAADTIQPLFNMRVRAGLTLEPGMQATVNLSSNGTDKVQLAPSGTLNYFQNFMGDMTLNGQLNLGSGFARYSVPVVGEKMFTFNPASYILWNGDLLNPTLNIDATDQIKASVALNGGNSHLVTFLVGLNVTNTLNDPKVTFDLSTDDDMSIQNELQAMTPDQRSTQAMNLLLYGQYTGPGSKTMGGPLTGNIYSFLASQVNSWAAKNIRGVDLTFGVDQYDKQQDGRNSTTTTYSYQVSKTLFNNRFKISVGGNYDTDASNDDIADNLLSDISLEYILKQTSNLSMFVKLYRQNNYESILEGEVTETGVGFVMKRKLNNLLRLFRIGRRKPRSKDTAQPDSTDNSHISTKSDSQR